MSYCVQIDDDFEGEDQQEFKELEDAKKYAQKLASDNPTKHVFIFEFLFKVVSGLTWTDYSKK